MPRVVNKSSRIVHFDGGMCGPGQTVELEDKEIDKPAVQLLLASGEVVEEREVQAAERKAAQAAEKAQAEPQKAQADAQKHQR